MYSSVLHDPYAGSTPSQRLAAAARNERQAKIASQAKPDSPIVCHRPLILPRDVAREVDEVLPLPGFDFGKWLARQERINPLPKAPWFFLEAEITPAPRKLTIKDIQRTVAKFYRVTMNDLVCERRQDYLIRPRQVAMFLSKELTPHSLPEIGRRFGNRDHTTVLHSVRKIRRLMVGDEALAGEIATLSASLVTQ